MRFCLICLLALALCCRVDLYGQARPKPAEERGIQLGLSLDGIAYRGDLSEPGSSLRIQLGGHLMLQSAKSAPLKAQACFGFGQVMEQADGPVQINHTPAFFQTRFWYGDLRVSWQPMPGRRWQPMLSLGAGLMQFTPRDQTGRNLSTRPQTREPGEDYNAIIPQLPAQVGLFCQLTPLVAIGASYTYRFVPSDYLDNLGNRGSRPGFDALQALSLHMRLSIGAQAPQSAAPAPAEPTPAPLPGEVMTLHP